MDNALYRLFDIVREFVSDEGVADFDALRDMVEDVIAQEYSSGYEDGHSEGYAEGLEEARA